MPNQRSKIFFWIFFLLVIVGLGALFVFGRSDEEKGNKADIQSSSSSFERSYSGAALMTNMGEIEIRFASSSAPIAVANFKRLAENSFYDGTLFHRVTKEFIQSGDPFTKSEDKSLYGTGGPGYKFDDEVYPSDKIARGIVAMANAGPNTNGSQFFIVTIKEAPWLDGKHTIFAEVVRGMNIADKISQVQTSKNNLPVKPVMLEKVILK